METKENKKGNKITFLHSIKTKVAGMVAIAIILATIVNMVVLVPYLQDVLGEQNKNYLNDLAAANGNTLCGASCFSYRRRCSRIKIKYPY